MENPVKENINELVEALRTARSVAKVKAIESKLTARINRNGTPIIEKDTAHFLYKTEDEQKVSIVGDWNKWQHTHDKLERLHPASRYHYLKKQFPIDARLSYRIVSGIGESFNDPNNPNVLQEVFGKNTYLTMPAYKEVEYWYEPEKNVPRGKIVDIEVLGNRQVASRTVQAYIPALKQRLGKQRILYVNDGTETLTIGKFQRVLDNLYFNEPNIKRSIVVFVPPVERMSEYKLNAAYAKWFATILVHTVERRLKLNTHRDYRAVQGASLGGLLSLHLGFHHSKIFGNIIAQSPSVWVEEFRIAMLFAKSKKLPLKFFLQTGTIHDALEGTRILLGVLQEKGYEYLYRETSEGHNWANWAGQYAQMLRWISNIT